MTFDEVLAQVREQLQREGRIAYRILKRRFDLSDDDTEDLKADLIREPDLKSLDVHVDTSNGIVMLSGFVPSQAEADKAIQVARNVKGVAKVENGLEIQPEPAKK